jgi:hypothetical protein
MTSFLGSHRRLVPCSKCHSHRISEIARFWSERASITVRFVTVTPVTHESQPRPGLAAGAFSLLAVVGRSGASRISEGFPRAHQAATPPSLSAAPCACLTITRWRAIWTSIRRSAGWLAQDTSEHDSWICTHPSPSASHWTRTTCCSARSPTLEPYEPFTAFFARCAIAGLGGSPQYEEQLLPLWSLART